MSTAGVPERYWHCEPEKVQHYAAVCAYAKRVGTYAAQGEGLLLAGPKGTGKSRTLGYIARLAFGWAKVTPTPRTGCPMDLNLRFVRMGLYHEQLRANERDWIGDVQRCYILLLDDIGAIYEHEWVSSAIAELVEARYSAMLPTCYSSNLMPAELAGRPGWERSADRLHETCTILPFMGDSLREAPERHRGADRA